MEGGGGGGGGGQRSMQLTARTMNVLCPQHLAEADMSDMTISPYLQAVVLYV